MTTESNLTTPPRVVGIGGYGRTGKDTFAQRLVENGYPLASFGETVAALLAAIDAPVVIRLPRRWYQARAQVITPRWTDLIDTYGYEGAKQFPEVRRLMQDTGESIKTWQPDFWVQRILNTVTADDRQAISGMRSPAEANGIRTQQGGFTVRINKPGVGPLNDHENEKKLDGYDFDLVIENDGTVADLWRVADALVAGQRLTGTISARNFNVR